MRLLVGADAQVVSPTFTGLDEEPSDLDAVPTVAVTSLVTGDTLAAPTATSVEADSGSYQVTLTADDHLGELDVLDIVWTGEIDGAPRRATQRVEVVGAFYNTIPDLRAIPTLSDAATVPLARLRKFRDEAEDVIEEARGAAYVPRVSVETVLLTKSCAALRLAELHPSRLLALSIDDVAQDVADYDLDSDSRKVTGAGWFAADSTVRVAYVHGYEAPPALLVEAEREYVRAKCHVDGSNLQRNPISVSNLATGEVYRYGTADPKFGRWTGIPEVDDRIRMVPDERAVVG